MSELSTPPGTEVTWNAWVKGVRVRDVTAQTWFLARAVLIVIHRCESTDVRCEMKPEEVER